MTSRRKTYEVFKTS